MTTPDPQTLIDSLTLEVQQLRAETGKLQAECETMRPVFCAALVWRDGRDRDRVGTAPRGGQRSESGRALIDAVDVADPRELPDG